MGATENKEPKLMRDWIGHEVELRREVETKGRVRFEAGTRFIVRGVGHTSGFILEEVGGARRLTGVPRGYVKLIASESASGGPSRGQQAKQVAYTNRAIYEALRELKCAGGDRIEKGELFTRRKVEGFGDRTFNFCRRCEPFEEPSAAERERFAGKRRKQRAAKLLRLRNGAEVKLSWRGEQIIGSLFCMYLNADFWQIVARAVELMRARSKNARLDERDLRQAEQELTRSKAVEMLAREERMRRAEQVRGRLSLEMINDGFSIEGEAQKEGR